MRLASVALSVLALGVAAETSAWGFVRSAVEGKPDVLLYWPGRTISYWINNAGYSELPLSEVAGAIRRSFSTWSGPACTDLSFVFGGLTDIDETNVTREVDQSPDLRNVIRWREDAWPPEGASDSEIDEDWLALTVLVFDVTTGEILDADMDLNGVNFRWTTSEIRYEAATDVQNVVTHEVGHVLGLAHTDIFEATMHAQQPQGEVSKRDLHADDIEGLCHIYPFGLPTTLGETQPRPTLELIGTHGCGVVAGGMPLPAVAWFVVVLIGLRGRCRPIGLRRKLLASSRTPPP